MLNYITYGRQLDATAQRFTNTTRPLPIPGVYRIHITGGGGGGGGLGGPNPPGTAERGGRGTYSSSFVYARTTDIPNTQAVGSGGAKGLNYPATFDGTDGASGGGSILRNEGSAILVNASGGAGGRGTLTSSYVSLPLVAIFPYETSEEFGRGGFGTDIGNYENTDGRPGMIYGQLIG